MAISPVNSVSFKSYNNNLTFEGKKKSYPEHKSAGFMKSIPLAAMLAMSPMVNAQTVDTLNNAAKTEFKFQKRGKTVTSLPFELDKGRKCNILFESTDNNDDDIEAIHLEYLERTHSTRYLNGEKVECSRNFLHEIYLDELRVDNITLNYDDGSKEDFQRYYVVGNSRAIRYPLYTDDSSHRVVENRGFNVEKEDGEFEITKELFDYFKELLGDGVKCKETYQSRKPESSLILW